MALGYCRESKENVAALRNQVRQLKRAGCTKILADVQSGGDDDRRFFQMALNLMWSGQYQTLKVPRLDRLSRVLTTHLEISEKFKSRGLKLVALDYGEIDISSPLGWQATVNAAVSSEYYLRQLSYNVKLSKEEQRTRGEQLGGPKIFGFKRINKKLTIDLDEYEIARLRIEKFLELKLVSSTCKWLWNNCGHKVSSNGLRDWLLNPAIYGHTGYNRQKSFIDLSGNGIFLDILYSTHPAIATQEEWDQIRFLMQENKRRKGKPAKKPPQALSGLVKCHGCGAAMAITHNGYRHVIRHCSKTRVPECDHTGVTDMVETEIAVNFTLSEKACEIVKLALSNSESPEPKHLIEKREELRKAQAMERQFNSPELSGLIKRLKLEITQLESGNIQASRQEKERLELISYFQDPDTFYEYTQSERFEIYHKLVKEIRIWNKQIISIKLFL